MHVEFRIYVKLQPDWETKRKLIIRNVYGQENIEAFHMSVSQLKKLMQELPANVEFGKTEDTRIIITGWAVDIEPITATILVDGDKTDAEVVWKYRKDVQDSFEELENEVLAGYEIELADRACKTLRVILQSKSRRKVFTLSGKKLHSSMNGIAQPSLMAKAIGYFKKYGFRKTLVKSVTKLRGGHMKVSYEHFCDKYRTTEDQLQEQRERHFAYEPLLSIVVPLYKTKEVFLQKLIESVQNQTYSNWELCFADGSGAEDNRKDYISTFIEKDKRIRYTLLEDNLGIAGNTNAAIAMADGDYLVLADHDDIIAEEALFRCVEAIDKDRTIDVIYSDEDKVDWNGKHYFEPHFKSDFNIDLLCSMNYICHLFVFHRNVLQKVGGFEPVYDGAQDHDFILRCVEVANKICHIPRVLYHWRCHQESTSSNPESKLYAFTNGCKAVEEHYKRIGVPATVEQGPFYGMYRTRYHWAEEPLLSIIIPNKDHTEDLNKCIKSILNRSTYQNYEIIIVENNSTEDRTFAYYKSIEQQKNVTVLYYEGEFNYSRINNFGAANAKGDYFLLLNNDTEMIQPDGIKEMMDICQREDVGIVGARLFYEDNTIQHAGVIIGFGGMAGHAFIGQDGEDNGYFSRILCTQDLSAVTAACLLVKRSAFEQVHGLSEDFKVALNDIDFCLKVRELGKLVVYNPYATFYHYESKSRGLEDSADKVARFNDEVALFGKRWENILASGDPYYNPNLTLDKADFSLKE